MKTMLLIQKNTVIQMFGAIFSPFPNEQALATELGTQNEVVLSNYRLVNPIRTVRFYSGTPFIADIEGA